MIPKKMIGSHVIRKPPMSSAEWGQVTTAYLSVGRLETEGLQPHGDDRPPVPCHPELDGRQQRVLEPRVAKRVGERGSCRKSSRTVVPPGVSRPTIASTFVLGVGRVDEEEVEQHLGGSDTRHDPVVTVTFGSPAKSSAAQAADPDRSAEKNGVCGGRAETIHAAPTPAPVPISAARQIPGAPRARAGGRHPRARTTRRTRAMPLAQALAQRAEASPSEPDATFSLVVIGLRHCATPRGTQTCAARRGHTQHPRRM